MRRLYIIIAIVVVALLIVGGGLYSFFAYRQNLLAPPATGRLPAVSSPNSTSSAGAITPNPTEATISTSTIFGMVADIPALDFYADGTGVTIIQPNGQVARASGGQTATLSSVSIPNIISAVFSPDGQKIMVAFGNQTSPQTSIFNLAVREWRPLPAGILNPVWSPDGKFIAYLTNTDNKTNILFLTLGDKPKPQNILSLYARDLRLQWPQADTLIIDEAASAYTPTSVRIYNIKNKRLSLILEDNFGLETIWDGIKNYGLAFIGNSFQRGGTLEVVDTRGNFIIQPRFLTLPSKCTFPPTLPGVTSTAAAAIFTPNTILCALPRNIDAFKNSPLPDAYLKKSLFTADDLYSLDIPSGNIRSVFADPGQSLDISSLKISGQKLFFINRLDKRVYGISP